MDPSVRPIDAPSRSEQVVSDVDSKPLSVCALVPYPLDIVPSQRYRIEQWAPLLAKHGVSVDFLPFMDEQLMGVLHKEGQLVQRAVGLSHALLRRAKQMMGLRRYDVVVVHRAVSILGPAIPERFLRILGCPILFDFDDAIFQLNTSPANRRMGWLKFPRKTDAICRLADQIVVGNDYLAEYARPFNPNVTVIPSSVDIDRYRPVKKDESDGRVVVGWTGSSTSQAYLEGFASELKRISELPKVEIRVHSDRKPNLPGIPHVWRKWDAESEIEELQQFDIGIMPMPNDRWTRGKCAMKALLYMSTGIPVVCSGVGMNEQLIKHDHNGMLASSGDDWFKSIERLIEDPFLRDRLGAEGRKTVEERYSADVCATKFIEVLQKTANR